MVTLFKLWKDTQTELRFGFSCHLPLKADYVELLPFVLCFIYNQGKRVFKNRGNCKRNSVNKAESFYGPSDFVYVIPPGWNSLAPLVSFIPWKAAVIWD